MAIICQRCEETITDEVVKCYGRCKGSFHLACTPLSARTYKAKSEMVKKQWRCLVCRQDPISQTDHENSETEEKKHPKALKKTPTDKDFEKKIDLILKQNEETHNTLREFMETVMLLKDELKRKEVEIKELKGQLNEFKQHYRCNFLELHNVEEKAGENEENLEEIMIKIGSKIGVNIANEEIEAIHRLPTRAKNKQKPIIVQLSSRKKRNTILQAKKTQTITQEEIQNNGNKKDTIFICESLTKENKELLYKTRLAAKEKNFQFVWTKNGKIMVRKDKDAARVIHIRDEEDIKKIA